MTENGLASTEYGLPMTEKGVRNDTAKNKRFYNKCWGTERLSAPTFFKIKRA